MSWFLPILAVILAAYLSFIYRDSFDPDSLNGKRVVLTGASSGIGEQMAYQYAKLGASLLITARTESRLQEVIARCKEIGSPSSSYLVADMSDVTSYSKLIQTALERLGGIDFLVLDHILAVPLGKWSGTIENLTLLQTTFDVNFRSYVHLASHALPYLQTSSGSIVVVSSIAGRLAQPYVTAYSASKFALEGFFSGLRQELRAAGSNVSITVSIIGLVGTDNTIKQLKNFGSSVMLDFLPPARPEDAAFAIVRGGAMRAREIYFPYLEAKLTTLFRDWFPNLLERFIQFLFNKEL